MAKSKFAFRNQVSDTSLAVTLVLTQCRPVEVPSIVQETVVSRSEVARMTLSSHSSKEPRCVAFIVFILPEAFACHPYFLNTTLD